MTRSKIGWIDGIVKTIDEDRYAQRFTPRKPRSTYSQLNKERLHKLIKQGKVLPEVLETIGDRLDEEFVFPPDIEAALRANKQAWDNFQKYSGSYQRTRIAFIDVARKQPEVFETRLKNFIRKTERDKQYGFGIEEYY